MKKFNQKPNEDEKMKMLSTIFFAFCLFMANALADIGPVNRSVNLKYDGSVDASTLDQRFINVINRSGGTLAAGSVVILDVSNDDGASVTTSTATTAIPHCVMAVSCAASALCKCQTYGYMAAATFDVDGGGNAAAGAPFFIGAAAGSINAKAAPAAADNKGGVFLDAATGDGSVEVFIKME
jgi:hypothetical protein